MLFKTPKNRKPAKRVLRKKETTNKTNLHESRCQVGLPRTTRDARPHHGAMAYGPVDAGSCFCEAQDFPRVAQMGTSLPSQGAARLAILHAARNGHISISRQRALAYRQGGAHLCLLVPALCERGRIGSLLISRLARQRKSPVRATKTRPGANSSFIIHNWSSAAPLLR